MGKSRHRSPSPSDGRSKSRRGHEAPSPNPPEHGFWKGVSTSFGHMKDKMRNSTTLRMFKTDYVVKMVNNQSQTCLRVTDFGNIDCRGDKNSRGDEQLHFVVTNHGWNLISLRSLTFPFADHEKYLRVKEDGKLYCNGTGKSDECKFRLHEVGRGVVTLESYKYKYHHIAVKADGSLMTPKKAYVKNQSCEFTVRLIGYHKDTPSGYKVNPI